MVQCYKNRKQSIEKYIKQDKQKTKRRKKKEKRKKEERKSPQRGAIKKEKQEWVMGGLENCVVLLTLMLKLL